MMHVLYFATRRKKIGKCDFTCNKLIRTGTKQKITIFRVKSEILKLQFFFYQLLLRTNQNRQKAEVLLRRSAKFAFVAYDWLGRNLYLSDIASPALIVCPLKHLKEGCLSLFHEETGSVVLHPLKG